MTFDPRRVPSPSYVIDESALRRNLELLGAVQRKSGCRILLALKGFAAFSTFPLVRQYLAGASASSLHEAMLAREEFGGEVHACAPAFRPDEFPALLDCADHIVFNSFSQWRQFRPIVRERGGRTVCGIRINPEHSEVRTEIYDPCRRNSRLGVTRREFREDELDGITGLHFHSLCELGSDALERTWTKVEASFGAVLRGMRWVNLGGGHHITRPGYDVDRLCRVVASIRERYGQEVYLEPGEAIALNTGVLVASVLDIVRNEIDIAILDTSAAAHMPDVLEMPYRPAIEGAGGPGEHSHAYRLAGMTCLAGDVIGDYTFPEPLQVGSRLVFSDMAHYTMVKNTTFNGVGLPAIVLCEADTGVCRVVRQFGYADYKGRLGPLA